MRSFLITGLSEQERLAKAEEIIGKNISAFENNPDFILLRLKKNSIGIEEVRNMQKSLALKPFCGDKKICLISEAQNLTTEAQNSLLKTLEEPPGETTILLTSPDSSLLIPTIVSRCQLVALSQKIAPLTENEEKLLSDFLKQVLSSSSGERLSLIEKEDFIKTRQSANLWLDKLTQIARNKMLKQDEGIPNLAILRLINKTKFYLNSNCNVRLTIENFLLALPFENR